MGPYLAPSVVIGLGEWGRSVAAGLEEALRDRCPGLARACPVLALPEAAPDGPERIRAHLRASRLAEVIRALEDEGLMHLDPVITPATHVYLVASLADDPDLALLQDVADLVEQAAAEIQAPVQRAALVDLATADLPRLAPAFPVYVTEPVTSHGLVVEPGEYRAAITEALVAAAQPGGSQLFAGRRAGYSTLGIAWLNWSQAALKRDLAAYLSRLALKRCLEGARRPEPAPAPDLAGGRTEALTAGLPFQALPGGQLQAPEDMLGRFDRRREPVRYLRRCVRVLERKEERWLRRIDAAAGARAEAEREQVQAALDAALRSGPAGLGRAASLLDTLEEGARRRQEGRQDDVPERLPPVHALVRRAERLERLPGLRTVGLWVAIGAATLALCWMAVSGQWVGYLRVLFWLAAGCAGYLALRQFMVARAVGEARAGLLAHAAGVAEEAVRRCADRLDAWLEERCQALSRELQAGVGALSARVGENAGPSQAPARAGALSDSLAAGAALVSVMESYRHLAPDLAERAAREGCLALWREPDRVCEQAEAVAVRFLADRPGLDPAQLVIRAYGDRLAERLQEAASRLLEWSRPLLARRVERLPEPTRWLVWPEGLPRPPVGPEVQVMPAARGCCAVLTILDGVQAGTIRRERRIPEEDTA